MKQNNKALRSLSVKVERDKWKISMQSARFASLAPIRMITHFFVAKGKVNVKYWSPYT